jgi:hypothetical protein
MRRATCRGSGRTSRWADPNPSASGRALEHTALRQLITEPLDWLGTLALRGAIELDEAQEKVWVGDLSDHPPEAALVELPAALHLPPQRVRPIMELDRRQQPLVIGETLREPTSAHRVVVLADSGQPLAHLELECVVDEGHEPKQLPPLAGLATLIERLEEVGNVYPDGTLRMACPRLTPGKALEKLGLSDNAPLQFRFRLEARNQLGRVHVKDATRVHAPAALGALRRRGCGPPLS